MHSTERFFTCHPVLPGNPAYQGRGMNITCGYFDSPAGEIFLAWEGDDILYLGFAANSKRRPLERMRKHFVHAKIIRNDAAAMKQGERILQAWRGQGGVRLCLHGTAFRQKVWKKLLEIPFGETVSYGDVAKALGQPSAARAVGGAVGANPVSLLVPCHRVVQSNGDINNYGWGNPVKKKLLALEGVE